METADAGKTTRPSELCHPFSYGIHTTWWLDFPLITSGTSRIALPLRRLRDVLPHL